MGCTDRSGVITISGVIGTDDFERHRKGFLMGEMHSNDNGRAFVSRISSISVQTFFIKHVSIMYSTHDHHWLSLQNYYLYSRICAHDRLSIASTEAPIPRRMRVLTVTLAAYSDVKCNEAREIASSDRRQKQLHGQFKSASEKEEVMHSADVKQNWFLQVRDWLYRYSALSYREQSIH